MTAPDHRSSSSREDDSWGKLASELLGINLGAEDDLDLSDLEPLPPPVALSAPNIEPPPLAPTPRPEIDLADMDFEAADEPELEDEDDRDEVAEEYESAAAETPAEAVEEAAAEETPAESDAFWDALETWDWESAESVPPPGEAGGERSRRPEGRGRGPRDRDRAGGRGGSRSDGGGAREERPPRRETDRPHPVRSESREEPPVPERRERRPEPRQEKPSRPAPVAQARPPRQPRPAVSGDEFGAGVVEGLDQPEVSAWRDEPPAPVSRPSRPEPRHPEPRRSEPEPVPEDEFAEDLLEEDELTEGEEGAFPKEEGADEAARPRRRRRRRRRRPAGDRDPKPLEASAAEGAISPPESGLEEEEGTDELDVTPLVSEDEIEEVAGGEERREPRGRRRRRRRPGDRTPRSAVPAREEEEAAPSESIEAEESDEFEADDEPVVAMSYEDIPTWEEAISYLLKPVGDGRREGGYRSGPPRRR